jgi:hypothetical protein
MSSGNLGRRLTDTAYQRISSRIAKSADTAVFCGRHMVGEVPHELLRLRGSSLGRSPRQRAADRCHCMGSRDTSLLHRRQTPQKERSLCSARRRARFRLVVELGHGRGRNVDGQRAGRSDSRRSEKAETPTGGSAEETRRGTGAETD